MSKNNKPDEVGDVIQVNPDVPDWGGCLLLVHEPKSFGCMAGLKIPQSGTAFIRLEHDKYETVGVASFVPPDLIGGAE